MESLIGVVVAVGIAIVLKMVAAAWRHLAQQPAPPRVIRAGEQGKVSIREYRVLTLGTAAAGKTCFMASLYNKLKSYTPSTGFYLQVIPQLHAKLGQLYSEISDPFCEWPQGTVSEAEWRFSTRVPRHQGGGSIHAFDFVYLDYAGGHLTDPDQATVFDVRKHIDAADAILVLLNGAKITRRLSATEDRDPRQRLGHELNDLIHLLNDAQGKPIHIIVSKWDLIQSSFTLSEVRDCLMGYRVFAELVAARADRGIPTRLIPVSAVGPNFATLGSNGQVTKRPHADPYPVHVEVSMAATLMDLFETTRAEMSRAEADSLQALAYGAPEEREHAWSWLINGTSNALSLLPFPGSLLSVAASTVRDFLAARTKTPDQLRTEQLTALQNVGDQTSAIRAVLWSHRKLMRDFELKYPESMLASFTEQRRQAG